MKIILLLALISCQTLIIAQNKYYEKQIAWTDVQDIHKIMVQSDTSFAVFGNYLPSIPNNAWWSYAMQINLQGDSICGNFYEDENVQQLIIFDATKTNGGYAIPLNVYVNDQNTYNGLLLVDSCGVLNQQSNYISPLGNTNCYTIARTFDNGYLIGGNIYADYDLKPYLLKVDSLGIFQWERAYTNVPQNGVIGDILPAADSSGYFVLSAYNYDDLTYTRQTRITKINNAGDSILLDRIYDFETDYYAATRFMYATDGNIVMYGTRHPYQYSGFVAKIDGTTLDTIWVNRNKEGGGGTSLYYQMAII